MDGVGGPRRLRLFHRLQLARSAAAVDAREEHPSAHWNRNVSSLADRGPVGRMDCGFSRTMAGQGSGGRELRLNFRSGDCDCNRSARIGSSHATSAGRRHAVSGFSRVLNMGPNPGYCATHGSAHGRSGFVQYRCSGTPRPGKRS